MGDIARASLDPIAEKTLYKLFGINAELLIDHAWGWEPTTIEQIRQYHPGSTSLSSGQVLKEPYPFEKGKLIVREMTELLVQDLIRRKAATKQMVLTIGYDHESLSVDVSGKDKNNTVYRTAKTGKLYTGKLTSDHYGRVIPAHAHGTGNLEQYTNSVRKIVAAVINLYEQITDPDLLIRRLTIAACNLIPESCIPEEEPEQLDLFTNYDMLEQQRKAEKEMDEKEQKIIRAVLSLQDRYGKNAVLKGMNFMEGGTTIERNGQIGGHKA